MSTIVTRAGKGAKLTWVEADANFNNLNTDKLESSAIGVTVQEYSANLDEFATVNPTAAGLSILDDATASDQLTTLGVSTFAKTILDDTSAADVRTTIESASLASNTFTGTQKWSKGADVASAGALTLGSDGNYFDITGTTTITSISTIGIGTIVKLHFDEALTLTHNATDLVLPGGANITTASGDEFEFVEYATGDWRCTNYTLADGTSVVSDNVNSGSSTTTTSGTSHDFSIPSAAKEILVAFAGTSLSGTSDILVQLGDSGGIETTGYISASDSGGGVSTSTAGFVLRVSAAANVVYGHMFLSICDSPTFHWVSSHSVRIAATAGTHGGGDKALSAAITQLRVTTVNGTDTFDAGKINVSYKL